MIDDIYKMSDAEFQNYLIVIQLDIMDRILEQKINEGKLVFSGTSTPVLN